MQTSASQEKIFLLDQIVYDSYHLLFLFISFWCQVCINFVYIFMLCLDCFKCVSWRKNAIWCRKLHPTNEFLHLRYFIL